MKWQYFLCVYAFVFNVSTFALEQEEKVLGKRPSATELEQQPEKKLSFARPTSDTAFKRVLQNDEALKSLIKAFLNEDVTSIQRLDESLTPIKPHGNVREVINSSHMNALMQNPKNFIVYQKDGNREVRCIDKKQGIFEELSRVYKDLKYLIPERERDSRVDVICRVQNDKYFMLEVQVAREMNWDWRALAYAAYVYGGQLKKGGKWNELMPVFAINILGRDDIRCWDEKDAPFRSYTLIDEYNYNNKIPSIKIFQCCLYNLDLEDQKAIREDLRGRKGLLDWLEYFKCAHLKDSIPEMVDKGLKVAYEKIIMNNFSLAELNMYKTEEELIEKFERLIEENREALIDEGVRKGKEEGLQKGREEGLTEGIQKGREEGIQEAKLKIAKNLKISGMPIESISSTLDINIEDLQNWLSND